MNTFGTFGYSHSKIIVSMSATKRTTRSTRSGSPNPAYSSDGASERTQNSSRSGSRASNKSIRRYIDDECEASIDSLTEYTDDENEDVFERVNMYRKFSQVVNTTATHTTPYLKKAFAVSSIYLFWVALHFITAQLYVTYCAHPSIYGFLISPFLISAPHCVAMRWVFTKGGTLIDGMWILLGSWLCSKVIYRDT